MYVRVFKQLCHENKTSSVIPVTVPAFSLIVPFKYVCVVSEKPPKRSKEKRDVFFVLSLSGLCLQLGGMP